MILIDNRSDEELPEEEYLALAAFVVDNESQSEDSELSISLVNQDEIHTLNREYRGIDAPTDVLAFENDGELLGDVVVCPTVAREHAGEFDSSFESEMYLMLIHGILHLLGYDHIVDRDAELMEARENELLELWKEVSTR